MDTIIEILIDNSNSMGPRNSAYLLPDGSTRMELARKILSEEIIPNLDYAKKITLRKFHSVKCEVEIEKPDIKEIYNDHFDKSAIIRVINSIENPTDTGGTPITAAIETSINELAKHPNADRKIFLVTDGEETGKGDYQQAAKSAIEQYGIPCNIFVIGISQDAEAEAKSKDLAQATGGGYTNLKAKIYDKVDLQSALRPIYSNAIDTSIQNVIGKNKPHAPTQQLTSRKTENELDKSNFNELIQNNSTALKLLSKQILNVTEAIDSLKKQNTSDDDKIEISEDNELNEKIRSASESYLFDTLKEKFGSRIKWFNEDGESMQSCDFEVFDPLDGNAEYYIECKASIHADKVFYMTKNEWLFFIKNSDKYQIYLISNALTDPKLTKIDNLMKWIISGRVLPLANKNIRLKANRIVFSIVE